MRMRTAFLLCGIVLVVAAATRAENFVEFGAYRLDQDKNGTADLYFAEIFVSVSGATAVDMLPQGGGTVGFSKWGDEFGLETDDYSTLTGLNAAISGTHRLRITHAGGVSDYQYTVGQVTEGMFPDIPTLATVPAVIQQDHTFQWTWSGTADEMFAEADIFGKFYRGEASDDGSFVVGTTNNWTPDFAPHTGSGAFAIAYEFVGDVGAGSGMAVSGWTLLSGPEVLGAAGDEVLEFIGSEDWAEFTVVELVGDANGDGVVDAADYIALKRHMGQDTGATMAEGDFDGDGDVDWRDLQLLRANYGETSAGGSVPEPGAAVLLLFGAGWVLRWRKART